MDRVFDWLERESERLERDLVDLLSIPSISTDPTHAGDVDRCAGHLAAHLERLGLETAITPTDRHPVLFARTPTNPAFPTVLIYGHYDVQPPDPLEEWESPPFEPTRRGDDLYARGASDDKGQFFAHVAALEAWIRTNGAPPLNVCLLLEGEEEIGSPNLPPYIERNRDILAADQIVISDTSQFAPGVPAITYGLKGLVYCEIEVTGPRQDLHSGVCGGTVMNPANALARILAALHDEAHRVAIPGFYDAVVEPTQEERDAWRALPFDEEAYRREIGVPELVGEEGWSTLERKWARPTLDVNGIWGGYTGPGAKTIIPARAAAKVSLRLVPDQDPAAVERALAEQVERLAPPGVEVRVRSLEHAAPPVLVPLDSPAVRAAERALEVGFGRKPVFVREGGTIPVVATFKELLDRDALLLGFGRPDDNIHGPNEKIHLPDFHRGARTAAALLAELAALHS